jgi:hypothetical protein
VNEQPDYSPDPGEAALAAIRAALAVLKGGDPTSWAGAIDLGDGGYCCQRATGPMCYEHEQIAQALKGLADVCGVSVGRGI